MLTDETAIPEKALSALGLYEGEKTVAPYGRTLMPNGNITRRALLGSATAAACLAVLPKVAANTKEWKPRLGILGKYTEANVDFAIQEGFNNMILNAGAGAPGLDTDKLTDEEIEGIKNHLSSKAMHVSALQVNGNHIAPDPAKRERENANFVKAIELAGKLGVLYIGTQSGKDVSKTFQAQVDEIVRVYHEKYFPACEKYHVRILWEPWQGGPNIATSPVGFEALFNAFKDSPYVGLQYDPSHLVWQMMDPIQTAKDFVDKIYDVHLKDTQIHWDIVRRGGIVPVDQAHWWQFRIPGMGSMNWPQFFGVLQSVGYEGAMSIEHEDNLYGASDNPGPDFSEPYKVGFRMAKRYLNQYVPV
jgi:sugar phosphate isomerase/epimerase